MPKLKIGIGLVFQMGKFPLVFTLFYLFFAEDVILCDVIFGANY